MFAFDAQRSSATNRVAVCANLANAGVSLIVNVASGWSGKKGVAEKLLRALSLCGVPVMASRCRSVGELASSLELAIAAPAPVVFVAGGDGTVSAAAACLADTDKTLAIAALGTFNHFAKDLGILPGIVPALRTLFAGVVHKIDVAEVNGLKFVNNAGWGAYPELVAARWRLQKRGLSKGAAAVLAYFSSLKNLRSCALHVRADGREFETVTPAFFVGNNEYFRRGLRLGRRKSLDAGLLDLVLFRERSAWQLVSVPMRAFLRLGAEERFMSSMMARQIRIDLRESVVTVALDGELHSVRTPLEFKIHPQKLRVLVPARRETAWIGA